MSALSNKIFSQALDLSAVPARPRERIFPKRMHVSNLWRYASVVLSHGSQALTFVPLYCVCFHVQANRAGNKYSNVTFKAVIQYHVHCFQNKLLWNFRVTAWEVWSHRACENPAALGGHRKAFWLWRSPGCPIPRLFPAEAVTALVTCSRRSPHSYDGATWFPWCPLCVPAAQGLQAKATPGLPHHSVEGAPADHWSRSGLHSKGSKLFMPAAKVIVN